MSRNAVFAFSLWTSVLSALIYFLYGFTNFGCPWVMFVCLAVFFGLGATWKDAPSLLASALAGCVWGKIDFLLTDLFLTAGLGVDSANFIAITLGTAAAMVLHIYVLRNTPFRHVPFIFAGVCLTFSQNNGNTVGLVGTFVLGLALCACCSFGQQLAMKRFPLEEAETR